MVINDQGQVLVVFAPRDLIDPDPEQAVQPVRVQFGGDDTFTGPPDGAPTPGTGGRSRSCPSGCRQPGEEIIEIAGEMRSRASEGDLLDDHPVGRATKPTQRATHLDLPHTEIEMPPP